MKMLPTGALAALVLAATAVPAQAHAYLVDSVPAKKQEVKHPLEKIRLVFSGKADAHFSTVKLTDAEGTVLVEATQDKPSREMTLPAPQLNPGDYQLHYRVLSADGDLVEGQVEFTVKDGQGVS
jgi:methionine-rich copper-binding protein CopC